MDTSSPTPTENKLTKTELLEWANFLYSRYENKYRKKLLKKKFGRAIIRMDTKRDKLIK